MKYTFNKYNISSLNTPENQRTYDYGVDYNSLNKEEEALIQINSHLWTPQKIQELIEESKAIQGDEQIDYQVEGGHLGIIITKTDGVGFFDLLNREKEYEDFTWSFDKFIEFLEDFKKFVEENS